jgi:hypothetical protein
VGIGIKIFDILIHPHPPVGTFSRQREKDLTHNPKRFFHFSIKKASAFVYDPSPAGGRRCRQADEGGSI